jgi:hypothetical protein
MSARVATVLVSILAKWPLSRLIPAIYHASTYKLQKWYFRNVMASGSLFLDIDSPWLFLQKGLFVAKIQLCSVYESEQ